MAHPPAQNQPVLVAPLHEGSPKEVQFVKRSLLHTHLSYVHQAKQYFLHVSKIVLVANSRYNLDLILVSRAS